MDQRFHIGVISLEIEAIKDADLAARRAPCKCPRDAVRSPDDVEPPLRGVEQLGDLTSILGPERLQGFLDRLGCLVDREAWPLESRRHVAQIPCVYIRITGLLLYPLASQGLVAL